MSESPLRQIGNRLIASMIGARGGIREIAFFEGGRRYECALNDDSLWGVVTDILMTRAYDQPPVRLNEARGVVIDAGAHVGLFSLVTCNHAQRVIALEPHPRNFELLQANLARNRIPNVEPRRRALWRASTSSELFDATDTMSPSLLGEGPSIPVECVSLDEIVEEAGEIDLLKLDVEGAEFEIIATASESALRSIRAIAAEMHTRHRPNGTHESAERLRALGFEVAVVPPPFYFWKEPIRRVITSWGRLEGLTRLKLTVIATFTAAAALRPVFDLRARLNVEGLQFLFATRKARADLL